MLHHLTCWGRYYRLAEASTDTINRGVAVRARPFRTPTLVRVSTSRQVRNTVENGHYRPARPPW